jgi:endonuclease/exonuclease/phosphatase family metal-dependent hydrolase
MVKETKLLCWNVHLNAFYEDNRYVVDELENLNKPDVICLQEYVQGGDNSTIKWLEANDYVIHYLPFATFPDNKDLSQGVLTATARYLDTTSESVVLRQDTPRKYRSFHNLRGAINTTLTLKDSTELNIINFHATYPRPFTIDMRKREFINLIDYVDSLPENRQIMLLGDFNFLPFDSRKKILLSKFDSYTAQGLQKTWKHSQKLSPLRANLDYILMKTNKLSIKGQTLPFRVSDHRPIIVEVKQI